MGYWDDWQHKRARRALAAMGVPRWVPTTVPRPRAAYYVWSNDEEIDSRLMARRRRDKTSLIRTLEQRCQEALEGRRPPGAEPDPRTPADLDAPTALLIVREGGIGHGSLGRPELSYSYRDLLYLAKLDLGRRLTGESVL